MRTLKTLLALSVFVLMPAIASADHQRWYPGDRHFGRYDSQVNWGIRTGALTPREAREIRERERQISRERSRFLADGRLTGWERRHLNRDYQELQHETQQELYDRERRRGNYWFPWSHW